MNGLLESLSHLNGSSPLGVALRLGTDSLTYSELDARSAQLAGQFRQAGVQPGSTVAICYERSFEWVTCALAAMRAGAAYLPIDLAWPDDRIRHILQDSGANLLVADAAFANRLAVSIPVLDPARDTDSSAFQPAEVTPDSLAYVIYTSGSTGTPKGVEVTHGNLAHLIAWHNQAFAVTPADRASSLAGLGFDAAVWELWPYLAAGATVTLVDENVRTSPELLQQWIVSEAITIGFVPTALAVPMINAAWPAATKLRTLLTGGDTLHHAPPAGLPFAVVNNYGPTETTVVATSGIVVPGTSATPSIGRAITGATAYVLDEAGKPTRNGETGELFIGGAGVARGYRNRLDQTAHSFLADPFAKEPGARMYRTGDRAAILPDGQIRFLGRIDSQVKIRGQRIELDEISGALQRHPDVHFAVVDVRKDEAGENYLVGYILPEPEAQPKVADLHEFLQKSLPAAMIPAVYVALDSMPLSANGKLDRTLLADPSDDNALEHAEAGRGPEGPIEETLVRMVQELLGREGISVEDDFFLLGGHSLLGSQLILRAKAAFHIELTLRDLFVSSTVERLAVTIEDKLIAELDEMSDEEADRLTVS